MTFGSFPIAERFVSINGEGAHAGKLAAFIRFPGCNLDCSYCDTQWARDPELTVEFVSVEELCDWVEREGVTCVTITGGEPTLQSDLYRLLHALARLETVEVVEIETNGSTDLAKIIAHDSGREEERPIALAEFPAPRPEKLCITMDYKLPSSGMEDKMFCENFELPRAAKCISAPCSVRSSRLLSSISCVSAPSRTQGCSSSFTSSSGQTRKGECSDGFDGRCQEEGARALQRWGGFDHLAGARS